MDADQWAGLDGVEREWIKIMKEVCIANNQYLLCFSQLLSHKEVNYYIKVVDNINPLHLSEFSESIKSGVTLNQ